MYQLSDYIFKEKIFYDEKTVVYKALRVSDNLPVTIKQINTSYPDLSHIIRIKQEYELNQMIQSKYVIKIFEMKEIDNLPILIMEDYSNQSLKQFFCSNKPTLVEFLKIAIEITQAISEIHKSNIIHNAISSDNIIVDNEIKITNFSIATLIGKSDRTIDNFQKIDGNVSYISPEQTGRMNRSVDYRTDFYSLGITLYEVLLGYLPFQAEDDMGMMYCHLAKEPLPPCHAQKQIPKAISDIIMKLLEKMSENRYQSSIGIIYDLEKCLEELKETGEIIDFEIGSHDISDRFIIPQKLYGRDVEIATLLLSLEAVSKGFTEIVTVSGYSGVGKSSLVNEIRKPLIKNKCLFGKGKFDELNYNNSYSALNQVFEGILHQILSSSKEQITNWKNTFLDGLKPNAKIIIDIIPSLELIIGAQPEVPTLTPNETDNRFNFVFSNFIKCLCSNEHPLIIFLDDMQWCDLITLKLLKNLVINQEFLYLFIIMSYRDNEVYSAHPLMLTLDMIIKSGIDIHNMNLKPLQLEHISLLLSETLHCTAEETSTLAELCLNKTEGNPFFLNQFLQLLYEKDLIWFDLNERIWKWDLRLIQTADITDNVIELLLEKIKNLSKPAQELLTLASLIGNSFDLNLLSYISKKSLEFTYTLLQEAVLEGLVLIDEKTTNSSPNIGFHFVHDKIQQAANTLIDIDRINNLHLEIGRLLLANINDGNYDTNLFDIVNHYNFGIQLISSLQERELLAELELKAGKRAKKATAYELASQYFQIGIVLLQEDCWQTQYQLSLSLYTEATETAYLIGNIDIMLQLAKIVDTHGKNILDKFAVNKIIIQAYVSQGNIPQGVDTSLNMLNEFGLNLQKKPSKVETFIKLKKLSFLCEKLILKIL